MTTVGDLLRGQQQSAAIVRALAAARPAFTLDDIISPGYCVFCGGRDGDTRLGHLPLSDTAAHEPSCPWRMAREWTAANAEIG